MVTTFYPPYSFGGDGMHVYRLSNELAQRGHTVDVFHCEDSYLMLNRGRPTGEFPNHENVSVHGMKSRLGPLSPLATQQTGGTFFKGRLKKALEQNAYDVIHYHNMSLIGITALSYGSAVKLYTTHEHWLVCPMHVLWKFNREVCTTKSCTMCQLAGKRPPQLWRNTSLLPTMLKHVDCFLSPSDFTRDKHLERGLDIPIITLPNFLPLSNEGRTGTLRDASEPPFFLFVGRLEYIKGLQNLIRVFKERPDMKLIVAGDGAYRNELAGLANNVENVVFLGRQDTNQLTQLYRSAAAVVVPSICYETFGQTIIEAFAQKTPVIVNDLGALPELVHKSGGGIVYQNETQLIDALKAVANDQNLRDDLGSRGHKAYLKYWSEEAYLNQYVTLIQRLQRKKRSNDTTEKRKIAVPAVRI
jgi:glycosyltransferase involved in cell wall biosynthesis